MIFSTSSFLSPRFFILAGVSIYLSFFLFSCSGEQPEPEVRTLETEQAVTEAQEITESVPVETAGDLEVSLWASENLVGDPIAIHMDDQDRKSTRLNSSHVAISYAVFCLKKKTKPTNNKNRQQ